MDRTLRPGADPTRWYLLGTLIAVELLMSFSFLGYIHIDPISVTTAYLPVMLAGALLGPVDATILGAVFGLASMWKASAAYVTNMDHYFSPFMSGHPAGSLILSVGSRMLFGLVIGLLYRAASQSRFPVPLMVLVSAAGETLHSFFVYSAMYLCFPELGYTPGSALSSLGDADTLMMAVLATAVVLAPWQLFRSSFWRQFQAKMQLARSARLAERYHRLSLWIILGITLCSALAVTFYFVNRITHVLQEKGIQMGSEEFGDLLHLQVQFLIGVLSLMALVVVFLIFNRQYAAYIAYAARIDPLTEVMTRKTFFQRCAQLLQQPLPAGGGFRYFIMVDLDHFKEINDRSGHPEGDRVLRETAALLREIFDGYGLVGRIGGDEFAVFLYAPVPPAELEVQLRHFSKRVRKIACGGRQVTCSTGALPITGSGTPEEFYRDADRLLYQAKEQGRDQFIMGSPDADSAESGAIP